LEFRSGDDDEKRLDNLIGSVALKRKVNLADKRPARVIYMNAFQGFKRTNEESKPTL
jgi:hypothetical protein